MRTYSFPAALICAALFPHAAALAGVQNLPWLDDFDTGPRASGALADDPEEWSIDGTGSAEIIAGLGNGGSQGLSLDTGSTDDLAVTQYLNQAFEPLIWTDFHAALAPYAPGEGPPDVPADATVAFYLTSDGDIQALDGNTWVTFPLGLDTGISHRYTFCQDFREEPGSWQLWCNGDLLTTTPLAFANPRKTPLYLRFQQAGERVAAIDDIRVQRGAPVGLDGLQYYDDWAGLFGWTNPGDSAPDLDANLNQFSNFQEYALDFPDPTALGEMPVPQVVHDPDNQVVIFTYRRNLDAHDVAYRVEKSPNLGSWSTVESQPEDIEFLDVDGDPRKETVQVKVPHPDPSVPIFLRLMTEKR